MSDGASDDGGSGGSGALSVKVAVGQFEPRPGNVRWNISQVIELAARAGVRGAELVVLPELCTTGYYMFDRFRDLAEPLDGPTVAILGELARRHDLHVVLGMAERGGDGRVYDSAVLVGPEGLVGVYRKAHLWDRERTVFTPGGDDPVIDAGGDLGPIGVLVCYDLEFPATAEGVVAGGARLLAAPAAFGNERLWRATLSQRARDLGVPVVAANRIGREGDTVFCGHSMVVHPSGDVLADAGTSPGLAMAELTLGSTSRAPGPGPGVGRDRRFIHPEVG